MSPLDQNAIRVKNDKFFAQLNVYHELHCIVGREQALGNGLVGDIRRSETC